MKTKLLTIIVMFFLAASTVLAGSWSGYVLDSVGSPLNGSDVSAYDDGTNAFVSSNLTDDAGLFRVEGITSSVKLHITLNGYQTDVTPPLPPITTQNSTLPFNITLTQNQPGNITGFVYDSNGSLDGATVRALQGAVEKGNNATITDGSYIITSLTDGTYDLEVSMGGYITQTLTNVLVQPGTTTSDVNFTLSQQTSCTQTGPFDGIWSTCSGGTQSKSVTYYDYNNVCSNTYVTSESQSCGGSSSTGGSRDRDPVITFTPQIKYPDFFEYNPIQYTLNRMDSVIFYHGDIKYSLMITDIQDNTATFKMFPTYDELKAEQGEIIEFALGDDKLLLTLLDATTNADYAEASTVNVNLFLETEEEPEEEDEPIIEKVKDAVIKVVGEIVPEENAASVAVGISISASTIILGLLIFFVIRRVTG